MTNLDFKAYEEKLQNYLKEDLHSETRNLILLDFSNILLNYDKERALLMWKNTKEPVVNKFVYHAYEINFLIAADKFDEAKSLLDIYKVRYPGKIYELNRKLLETILLIFSTNEIIEDIEKRIVWVKNNRLDQISKLYYLMVYYHTRKMKDSAIKYATKIKLENAGCTEIDKLVDVVLKEE